MKTPKLKAEVVLNRNRMVIKGKPAQVMAVINDMIATHGEDATLADVHRNTSTALRSGE